MLGSRWVMRNGDDKLAAAATNALAKISAVLPPHLQDEAEGSGLVPGRPFAEPPINLGELREALARRAEGGLPLSRRAGAPSVRVVWPIALTFHERVRVLAAWCELRQDYRHFRLDRMSELRSGLRNIPAAAAC